MLPGFSLSAFRLSCCRTMTTAHKAHSSFSLAFMLAERARRNTDFLADAENAMASGSE
jgi:hypothetical protein